MANQSKLKKKNYDVNKIPEAIAAIKNGMLIKDASVTYGIPRSTLCDKLHKKYASGKTQPGSYVEIYDTFYSFHYSLV